MSKKPLESFLGQLFIIAIYLQAIVITGFIIYLISTKDYSGLIAALLFGVSLYFIFARKVFRFKTINFDKNHFYFKNGTKINLANIQNIHNGRITYIENNIEKTIYVNPYFPSKNHKLFTKYYNSKKLKV